MKGNLIFCILLFAATIVRGQNISLNHFTTDEGLSQFSVNCLYIDEKGIVWMGTREGLNSYNGNTITTLKQEKNNPNSLLSNLVRKVTGNRNGKLYILCTDGVSELNLVTQRFATLKEGNIGSLYFKQSLYISCQNEVLRWDEEQAQFVHFYALSNSKAIISAMHIDTHDNLWIGTERDGVYKLAPNKQLTHPISVGNVTSLYEDTAQALWIGSWEHGLYRITNNEVVTNFRHEANNPASISSNFVRSSCEDNSGNIWIGTFNGLNRFDKASGTFRNYTADDEKESLTHSSIWCIDKDQQGTLWIGTYFGGVNYFNPEYEIYSRYNASTTQQNGLSSPIVGRMLEDNKGHLWIGTEGGGVNVYNRTTKQFAWFKHQKGKNSLSHNNVKALYCDNQRQVMWIGTHLGGLNRLDIATGHFTHYRFREGDPTSLPSDIIRDIIPYREQLIIATQEGVRLFDPLTGRAQPLADPDGKGQHIKMVADLFIDHLGLLWIAATGEGVFSYNFETKQFTNYRHDPDSLHSLSSNNINNIMQDSSGNLWFSTSGSGLDLFHPQTGRFENFDSAQNELASDCVYEVRESSYRKGCLLLITNQGFSQFDYPNRLCTNYSPENGFPLTAVNENAIYVANDGEVFLGGIKGLISFREQNLHFTPKPYQLLFTRLTVNGREVKTADQTNILPQAFSYTSAITLTAEQSMFSIELASTNHIPANHHELVYRLEGFSNEWTALSGKPRVITYTNLNPGSYSLVVKAIGDGSSDVAPIYLKIEILPPLYKTIWAYLLYLLSAFALLYYLVKAYKSHIKLEESLKYEQKHIQDLEELNQSKLRFFTNISHEFRTPLTLIVGQMETLLKLQSFTPSVYGKILGIYKSSLQLRELITELLDFRKQEQGHMKIRVAEHNLVAFLYENYLLFQEYARSRQITILFTKEEEEIAVYYDQKQLQKVINNLLSNALKHTQSGDTITIFIRREGNRVTVKVQDTGVGIAAEELDKIFDRFYQTEQIGSLSSGAGTGIGLALTKGIVELHHGTIGVTSQPGSGSTFYFSLRLGHQHFGPEEISTQREVVQQPEQPLLLPDQQEETELLKELVAEKRKAEATLLIVEDNDDIRQMLTDIFTPFYRVETAANGQEALEKIHQQMPDIVLSDVVMPTMSGTELCREIKSNHDLCHIPVVLLTARTAPEHTLEGLRIGADDYVTKPFKTSILISRCNNLVNSRILLQEKFSKQPQAQARMLATNPFDKDFLDKAMNIIEQHMDDTEFNVNSFAAEIGMARTNLFSKLKAITGQTPNDFILTIRLKKGALLLRNNPELNISEVADRIGFSSSRYFSKCFKEAYRVTPLSYRRGIDEAEEETTS